MRVGEAFSFDRDIKDVENEIVIYPCRIQEEFPKLGQMLFTDMSDNSVGAYNRS